jgi:hypothetical protein
MGEAFRLGPEAHEAYCAFYREFEDRPLRVRNPYLGSFASRLTTYALKLAILYELAYFPDSREVSLDAWEHARAFTEMAYQGALRLLEETEVGGDRDYNRVLTILREAGEQGLRQRDLMRRAGLPKPKFDAIREALVEGGAVRWWNEMTAGRQAVMLAYAAPDE